MLEYSCMTKTRISHEPTENCWEPEDTRRHQGLENIPSPHEPNTPFVLLIAGAHSPNVTHSYTNTLISLEERGRVCVCVDLVCASKKKEKRITF